MARLVRLNWRKNRNEVPVILDEEIKLAEAVVKEKQDILEKLEKEREDRQVKAVLKRLRRDCRVDTSAMTDDHLLLLLAATPNSRGEYPPGNRSHIDAGLIHMCSEIATTRRNLCRAYRNHKEYRKEDEE